MPFGQTMQAGLAARLVLPHLALELETVGSVRVILSGLAAQTQPSDQPPRLGPAPGAHSGRGLDLASIEAGYIDPGIGFGGARRHRHTSIRGWSAREEDTRRADRAEAPSSLTARTKAERLRADIPEVG